MKVLSWHVHGAWSTAFVQGAHDHLVPVVPGRGPDGRGRAGTYPWPESVAEITPAELAGAEPSTSSCCSGRATWSWPTPGWAAGGSAWTCRPCTSSTTARAATCRTPGTRWPAGTTSRSCTSPTSTS